MSDRRFERASGETGFALVLAILSLMLLTFLGLTLATTTSTELQIATNYRWSQQALYNAEAGLEAARVALANVGVADPVNGWLNILPVRRMSGATPVQWSAATPGAPGPDPSETMTGRDFHRSTCDARGGGMGYGRVFDDGTTRLEDVTLFEGQTLNGAFTVWVRRPVEVDVNGLFSDAEGENARAVIVSEGVAPYSGAATAFTQANQAVRVLEVNYTLAQSTVGDPCETYGGQEGYGPTGEGYNPCAKLDATAIAGSLSRAFNDPSNPNSMGNLDATRAR